MNSNLAVRSNLMLDDENHREYHRYLPGDFVKQVYPNMVDVRSIRDYLSPQQIIEHQQYLICTICGRPCAGTCVSSR